MIYLVMVLVFLFVYLVSTFVLLGIFYKEKPINKLKYFDENYVISEKLENDKKKKVKIFKFLAGFIPHLFLNIKKIEKQEFMLLRADIPFTAQELLVMKLLSSSALAFLGYSIFRSLVVVLIVFMLIWNLPKIIIKNRISSRIKAFDSQLNEGIMIISNSIKAGYSFLQSIAVVTEETKDPFSKEFKKLLKEMSLGIPEEDALKNLVTRMESQDLKLILNAILIQKDIGGNLSEILDNIAETIRERQKMKDELKTLMAQGKLSGIIVVLIPIFLGIIIYLFNKDYMLLLFTTPVGLSMIGISIFNQLLGILMIKKIISIDM